jgi:uncharacterized damage-inducible protein DinB
MTGNDMLASAYQAAGKLTHMMTDDLTPAEFTAQPIAGGNSVAWTIGHLAVTLSGTAKRLGATDFPVIPPELASKFTTTRRSADVQTDLGGPGELLPLFDAALASVIGVVPNLTADQLSQPPRGRAPFSTTEGGAILFGASHIILHAGQISLIRRSLGKPPLV